MGKRKVEPVKRYLVIDKETGDVVAEEAMFIGQKPYVDRKFRKVFVGFLKDVVMDRDIAGKAIRLLLYIIENLKPNDLSIMLYWKVVCEELNIGQMTYYRWLNVLIKKGILQKTDIPNLYKLVPYQAVNGQMEIAINKTLKTTG